MESLQEKIELRLRLSLPKVEKKKERAKRRCRYHQQKADFEGKDLIIQKGLEV